MRVTTDGAAVDIMRPRDPHEVRVVDEAYMVARAGRLGVADELADVLCESGPP